MRHIKDRKTAALAFLVLLLLAAAILALIGQHTKGGAAKTAMIYQDNILIREVNLAAVTKAYTFTVESPDGGYNTIRVEPGRIGVSDADCPDKLCQKMGMTDSSAYPITCLPHKLLIVVSAGDTDVDAVAN